MQIVSEKRIRNALDGFEIKSLEKMFDPHPDGGEKWNVVVVINGQDYAMAVDSRVSIERAVATFTGLLPNMQQVLKYMNKPDAPDPLLTGTALTTKHIKKAADAQD